MNHHLKKGIICFLAIFVSIFTSCEKNSPEPPPNPDPTPDKEVFAKGADVSWLSEMESKGCKFYNSNGTEQECMSLLKSYGVNSIRLRVWVNPKDKWNNIDDVLMKAKRANSIGLKIMIDFHYSDTWADPGKQITPAAWVGYDIKELCAAVNAHTSEMMNKLKANNITPEWVQVGNETRGGMLYPLGAYENGANYANLTNAGYDAVKAVFAKCKVIVHIDNGDNIYLYNTIFDNLKQYGGKYDLIGMSLYPEVSDWKSKSDKCIANINTLYAKYGKESIICEVGMSWDQAEASKNFLSDLIKQSKENTNGKCKGVFYWEPQSEPKYNDGYTKGCFSNGRPTIALDAFK